MQLILTEKVVNVLRDLRNFNEIFRKDVAYDNIKSHKKQGSPLCIPFSGNDFF